MAELDDLDDLLDSALHDFRALAPPAPPTSEKEAASSVNKPSLGQGLGLGLPALGPKGKKASPGKPKSSARPSSSLPPKREGNSSSSGTSSSSGGGGMFSDVLEELAQQTRSTLEGMGTSSDIDTNGDKLVESIVKQFEELGTNEDFQSVMDTMMRQLLSKEVLHEPMREFRDKYPRWLETNKPTLSNSEFGRYSKQFEYIKELCGVYETTPDDFERIVDIMQNMQACGQPPNDLVQELAPDMPLGGDDFSFLNSMLQEGDQGAGLNKNCSMM